MVYRNFPLNVEHFQTNASLFSLMQISTLEIMQWYAMYAFAMFLCIYKKIVHDLNKYKF